jgi:putative pyruvate formate lyase activating enzyme
MPAAGQMRDAHEFALPLDRWARRAYDSLDCLRLLEGIVDVYMPDFKLWTSDAARRYLKRADYPEVARETIVEMNRQVGDLVLDERGMTRRGLILRHLIMPGMLEETEEILRFASPRRSARART